MSPHVHPGYGPTIHNIAGSSYVALAFVKLVCFIFFAGMHSSIEGRPVVQLSGDVLADESRAFLG